jgi:NifU-like protein involved in Fe-S cluster formation
MKGMISDLYNSDILTLSAGLVNTRLPDSDASVRKVSKLCGSWVEIDLKMENNLVSDYALRVQACALGQASAAILKAALVGASLKQIRQARKALEAMLKDGGAPPRGRFSKLKLLSGVAQYPARHTSVLLAFRAAEDAAELAQSSQH